MIHLLPFCLELMDLAGVFANTAAVTRAFVYFSPILPANRSRQNRGKIYKRPCYRTGAVNVGDRHNERY